MHSMALSRRSSGTIVIVASLGLLAALSVWSGDNRPGAQFSPLLDSASAGPSLLPAMPADVAREVMKIQQQLGGSIVQEAFSSFDLPDGPSTIIRATAEMPLPTSSRHTSASNTTRSQTGLLRDSAWELDRLAHQFEIVEMYDQADALRSMATKLREDARSPE